MKVFAKEGPPAGIIPDSVERTPVVTIVTGEIKAMPAPKSTTRFCLIPFETSKRAG